MTGTCKLCLLVEVVGERSHPRGTARELGEKSCVFKFLLFITKIQSFNTQRVEKLGQWINLLVVSKLASDNCLVDRRLS